MDLESENWEKNRQKYFENVFAGVSSTLQTPILSHVTDTKINSKKNNEDDPVNAQKPKNESKKPSPKRDLQGTREKSTDDDATDESHVLPPFLSNSDGAKYIKTQLSQRRVIRDPQKSPSQEHPIFLGGHFMRHSKNFKEAESSVADVTSASTTSLREDGSASTDVSSQYFLFPPLSENAGISKSASSSNLAEQDSPFTRRRSSSPPTLDDKKILRRRKSKSTSFSPLIKTDFFDDDPRTKLPRRVLKRQSMFPHARRERRGSIGLGSGLPGDLFQSFENSSRSSLTRHSPYLLPRSDVTQSSESILQQQRWKHKAFSQPQSFNHRILQRRLRVGYSHEILNDLRSRRRSKHPSKVRKISAAQPRPLDRFRRMVMLVRLLIRCLVDYRRVTIVSQVSQMSFAMMSSDMVARRSYRHGLTFDPSDFRAQKEGLVSEKLREILTLLPDQRNEKQVEYALKCLRAGVEEFAEFPLSMQQALAKVAWLDEFEPKRVIIRQGHRAETFYFIISGTALVTRNRINRKGEGYVETVSILRRGKSFGELALLRHEQRTNNVVSHTHIALLTVGRKDFIDIFMHRMDGNEPEFISFLRKLPEFRGFPLNKIPRNKPKICAFTYFRVGVVICADSSKSDVIVIVKSGVCRVVKRLNATRPNLPGLREAPADLNYETASLEQVANTPSSGLASERPVLLTSPTSPVSLLIGPKQPTLMRMLTLSLMQQSGKSSFSRNSRFGSDAFDLNSFNKEMLECLYGYQGNHRKEIARKYRKWQQEHPISRETFALLMTGRELEENEERSEEEEEEEEGEDKFDIRERLDSYFFKRDSVHESDDSQSRRSSTQSNFRTQILRRNRQSLADAWMQRQKKKSSVMSINLPTLNESVLPQSSNFTSSNDSPGCKANKPVYIHVETLRESDVFGLLPIVFDKSEGATPVSLISDGAECILINKEFFLKYFDDELRERLVRMIRPYPSEDTMQTNMQNQTNWDAYKFMTVHSHMLNRVKAKQVLSPQAMTTPTLPTRYKYMFSR